MIVKGAGQGIPIPGAGPGVRGALGQARSAAVQAAVSAGYNAIAGVGAQPLELGITASGKVATAVTPLAQGTLGTIANTVAVGKFVFDIATFGYGLIFACSQ